MKTFKIAHLYYDLMNLYGENGNIRYLKKKLEEQDIKVKVDYLSLGDEINIADYDLFYMGMGSEENQLLVIDNILKYKEQISEAINNNRFFIVTGNSLEVFGNRIENLDGSFKECLGIFNFKARENDERIVGEQYYKTDLISQNVIGFQNRPRVMSDIGDNLFKVITGTGYNKNIGFEGIHDNNFYGTYLLGPILVRNPYLTDYFVKEICNYLDIEYKKQEVKDDSYKAYQEYLKNFELNEKDSN